MSSDSNIQTQLPSIYDLEPLEKGGEVARQGFIYQDHVGAGFCLDMLELADLLEAWFETHDDITLIWKQPDGSKRVEFVQVKHEDRQSRWSISALVYRDKKASDNGDETEDKKPVGGTSLLEKSLNNSRCEEDTCFRIVTSYDVNNELEILKTERDGNKRKSDKSAITALAKKISEKLGDISAPDGTTIEQWTDRCYWDKRPETDVLIQLENTNHLEQIAKARKQFLYPDHRDEIYKRLLALVQLSALTKYEKTPKAKRISNPSINQWWELRIREIKESGPSAGTLQAIMKRAGIPSDVRDSATEIRMAYLAKRLDHDYISSSVFKDAEMEVTSILQLELARLDSGELSDNGIQFHTRCLNRLKELADSPKYSKTDITLPFLQGYMYERANRGVHRFDLPQP